MKLHGHNRSRASLWVLVAQMLWCFIFVVGETVYLHTKEELAAMTEDELEKICTSRGFAIVRDAIDPATGKAYDLSHEDFVNAAIECLTIEQEINEILESNPALKAEVEAELEAEKKARLAEVEMLEKELEKAQEAAAERSNSSSSPAFVGSVAASDNANKSDSSGVDDFEIIDDGDSTTYMKEDVPVVEDEIPVVVEAEDEEEVIQDVIENATELAAPNNRGVEDFTMKAISFEVIRAVAKEIGGGFKRIVELVTPVVQPILRAGDVAWRHLRVVVQSLRSNYEKSKADEEEKVQGTVPS